MGAPPFDWTAGPADVAVAAKTLAYRTDREAAHLLTELAGWAATAIVVEASRPDGLSPHAAEAALQAYAATGGPLRDSAAIAALAERTGWYVDRVVALGWGTEATVPRRARRAAGPALPPTAPPTRQPVTSREATG